MIVTQITLRFLLFMVCEIAAEPLPSGAHFIGDGYNILLGNPDGAQWLSGGQDPGFLLSRHIFDTDINAIPEITYEHHDKCQETHMTELVYNPKSYQDKLMQHLVFSGNQIQNLQNSAFTLSSGYNAAKTVTSVQHQVIQDKLSTCVLGTARYQMALVSIPDFSLTNEFVSAVCSLPETMDDKAYTAFIDIWGTHVVTELRLGYKETNRTVIADKDYINYVLQNEPADVSIGGPLLGSGSSYVVDLTSFKFRNSFIKYIGTTLDTLKTGSTLSLEPVDITLASIDEALTLKFWTNKERPYELCPYNITHTIDIKRQNLQHALANYASVKGAEVPAGGALSMPVVWPSGTYGLPKSATGCPEHGGRWLDGWLKQNVETQSPDSSWTANHLDATLTKTMFLLRFCIKTDPIQQHSVEWPKGDYCIFKFKDCPLGFTEGFVQWDDENTANANTHGGILPDGSYGHDTRMKYCCRSDGDTYVPITLPSDKPFYLFQYQHGCQSVRGMTSTIEHLVWDDDDTHSTSSAAIGVVHPGMRFCNPPKYPGCGTASTIYYCYYQKANEIGTIVG